MGSRVGKVGLFRQSQIRGILIELHFRLLIGCVCASFEFRMKTTQYFEFTRKRPDRSMILDEWILSAINNPEDQVIQSDGRIRRWTWVNELSKYLRVILLEDGITVYNAFFDRDYKRRKKHEN